MPCGPGTFSVCGNAVSAAFTTSSWPSMAAAKMSRRAPQSSKKSAISRRPVCAAAPSAELEVAGPSPSRRSPAEAPQPEAPAPVEIAVCALHTTRYDYGCDGRWSCHRAPFHAAIAPLCLIFTSPITLPQLLHLGLDQAANFHGRIRYHLEYEVVETLLDIQQRHDLDDLACAMRATIASACPPAGRPAASAYRPPDRPGPPPQPSARPGEQAPALCPSPSGARLAILDLRRQRRQGGRRHRRLAADGALDGGAGAGRMNRHRSMPLRDAERLPDRCDCCHAGDA